MARTVRDTKLDTRAARDRLAARHEPYWRTLYEGAHLGYRKGKRGGSWLARWRPSHGRYVKATLGLADDVADADGETVLSFKQAQEKARAWIEEQQKPRREHHGPYTVRDAVAAYLAEMEHRGAKSVRDARTRAEAQILPDLGDIELSKLTAQRLKQWHRDLAKAPPRLRTRKGAESPNQREFDPSDPEQVRRRRATANRVLTTLKAALNHAWREGKVASDDAWRRVTPFKEADAARVRYLSADEITRLVNACEPPFRELVQGALYTGCRYGELIRLQVADFNPDARTVNVRASKSGKGRHVVLTDEGAAFFERVTAGRRGNEALFERADGKPWGRAHQTRPLKEACERARIAPAASFHALRHTYASHLAMNGVPLPVVAANLGHTDTRMVERHYGHLAPSYIADTIRRAGLGYEVPDSATNVERLRPATG